MSTILLVEDEPLLALFAQEALEDAGYRVLWGADADEGAALLGTPGLHLAALVTDIHLGPGPSGFEFARMVRKKFPDLPVIYATGQAAAEVAREGVPGAVLLQKPIFAARLVTAVGHAIADAKARDSQGLSLGTHSWSGAFASLAPAWG